jgi:hypothetical protein
MKRQLSRASSSLGRKRLRFVSAETLEQLNLLVPQSLISVAPFLEEGLHVLRQTLTGESCVLAQSCFQHAFAVVEQYDLPLDDEGLEALISFKKLSSNIENILSRHAVHPL